MIIKGDITMKRINMVFIIVCLLTALFPLNTFALVKTTSEPAAADTIYIAGNPDMYPIEYYDETDKMYKGVLPDIYAEISEDMGVDFTYISAGNENNQKRLAKNNQVEIISAYEKGTIENIADEYIFVSFEKNEKEIELCVGFSEIAPDNVVYHVRRKLENIDEKELLSLTLKAGGEKANTHYTFWIAAFIAMLIIAVLVLLLYILVKDKKTKEEEKLKLTDTLTGIGNELYFRHTYDNYVSDAAYSLYYVVYISFDVGKFESHMGTTESEELQHYVANILASSVKDSDFVGRINNGVFALCIQSPSEKEAEVQVRSMLKKLNSYKEKMLEEYGILFRAGIFHLSTANLPYETVLFNARQGYKHALEMHENLSFCDDMLINSEALKSKLLLRLMDGIKNDEFKLYLQFIVDAEESKVIGAEALSRWETKDEGVVMPLNYIDSLKSAGIIDRLDFHVFEQICALLHGWHGTDKGELWLSCNFAKITLSREDFFDRIKAIADRYEFDRSKLIMELTEDSLVNDAEVAFNNVKACKEAGFRVALDDMGSGYSSFSDLWDYPIDIIKIDRHITARSVTGRGNLLLSGIIKFAHTLGIKVICEGVESAEEDSVIRSIGCDYIQGYYYSRVLPKDEALVFYEKKYKNKYSL